MAEIGDGAGPGSRVNEWRRKREKKRARISLKCAIDHLF